MASWKRVKIAIQAMVSSPIVAILLPVNSRVEPSVILIAAYVVLHSARLPRPRNYVGLRKTLYVMLPKHAQEILLHAQPMLLYPMVSTMALAVTSMFPSHAAVGKSCGSNNLACASGQCTSISKQCQMIGASMNLQNACPNQNQNANCQVSCQDPTQANQCIILQAPLIDGSPCGKILYTLLQ